MTDDNRSTIRATVQPDMDEPATVQTATITHLYHLDVTDVLYHLQITDVLYHLDIIYVLYHTYII